MTLRSRSIRHDWCVPVHPDPQVEGRGRLVLIAQRTERRGHVTLTAAVRPDALTPDALAVEQGTYWLVAAETLPIAVVGPRVEAALEPHIDQPHAKARCFAAAVMADALGVVGPSKHGSPGSRPDMWGDQGGTP